MTTAELKQSLTALIRTNPRITANKAWHQLGKPRAERTIAYHLANIREAMDQAGNTRTLPDLKALAHIVLQGHQDALADGDSKLALEYLKEYRQIRKTLDATSPPIVNDTRAAILQMVGTK